MGPRSGYILFLLLLLHQTNAAGLETRVQDFLSDPAWSMLGNGQNGNSFGWSATTYAGGEMGEVGGRFTRSNFVRYLADTSLGGGFTIAEPFSAAGTFSYTDHNIPDFGNGFAVGHFARSVADGNGNGTKVGISFTDNSRREGLWWQGNVTFDDGGGISTPPLAISPHEALNWSYDFVPDINGAGDAQVAFNLNGLISTIHLNSAQQQALGGAFDAFGMIGSNVGENVRSDWFADMFIDDVSYSVISNSSPPSPGPLLPTRTETFDEDPGWSILGSGQNGNGFGYSADTSVAGGETGEAGGRFTRSGFLRHYGDADLGGTISLDQPFSASGKFDFADAFHPDFGEPMMLGHFKSRDNDIDDDGNKIGLAFNNIGNDLYWNARIRLVNLEGFTGPNMRLAPNVDREWSYEWNPDGGIHGAGRLSASLTGPGGGTQFVDLTPEQRAIGATFDAFGLNGAFTNPATQTASWFADLFIDDVTYSIARPPLVGDCDDNGTVEQRDLDIVLVFWGEEVSEVPIDFRGDEPVGIIDQGELDRVLANWGGPKIWKRRPFPSRRRCACC